MARRSYRQRRRYRGRSRWSANINELSAQIVSISPNGKWFRDYTLAFNPIQTNTAVTQLYTVKNFEINFTIDIPSSENNVLANLEDICAYIMFVPQGMTVTSDYNLLHPEYIMAYKFLGSPNNDYNGQQYQPFRIKTRLSRKLQSGDQVKLLLIGNNTSTSLTISGLEIHGVYRWWTKAN